MSVPTSKEYAAEHETDRVALAAQVNDDERRSNPERRKFILDYVLSHTTHAGMNSATKVSRDTAEAAYMYDVINATIGVS